MSGDDLSSKSEGVRGAASSGFRIWVVDDDPDLRQLLAEVLGNQGYQLRCLHDGQQLRAWLGRQRPDLLVLDLMLPGDDGLKLLRQLRDAGDDLPVLMLTARADGVDRIIGLEQGADDYLAKPFLPRELIARIEAIMRRRLSPAGAPRLDLEPIKFGAFCLDPASRRLRRDAVDIPLTSGEFSLLLALAERPYRPLSRQQLIDLARGPLSDTDCRSMDVQVSRLRRLLEDDPSRPRWIQTVWGHGYVFVPSGTTHH
jgi:two-component system phosphate regulon response regulator OmpR